MNTSKLPRIPLLLLLLLGIASPSALLATTYWVATNGDDARTAAQATNSSTPWATIQRAAQTMVAGDTCNIRGGNYYEVGPVGAADKAVTPANSGTPSAPITFQAYGSEIVILHGAESISGWTALGGNIWSAPMTSSLGADNQVFINGAMKPEARWPNAGSTYPWQNSTLAHPAPYSAVGDWSYVDTSGYGGTAAGWFTDAQLPVRADNYWNGATVNIVSGYGWIMQSPAVTGYAAASKTITTNDAHGPLGGAYSFAPGNEYYLTGVKGELDSPGEWFYDAAASGGPKLLLYSTTAPVGVTVKTRPYGFNLSGKSNIKLVNLDFLACTVKTDANTSKITYDGLVMTFLGHRNRVGAGVFGLTLHDGDMLCNSELAWDSRGLVQVAGSDIRVVNNYLHDSGYMATWDAVVGHSSGFPGYRNLISHNTIQHAGRGGAGFPGRASIFEYNDVSDAMKQTTDGAVFYTASEAGNTIVRYNKLHDSPGPVGHGGSGVQGFYIDNQNSSWVVHHNLIWNLPGYAMHVNCRNNFDKIFNNTSWGTAQGALVSSFPMSEESGTHVFNNLFNSNPNGSTWSLSDVRFNLYNNTAATNAGATDAGIFIPGITDVYPSSAVGLPDIGALEAGGTDWRPSVGNTLTAAAATALTYSFPVMTFANQVRDGSFESGALAPNWSTSVGSNVTMLTGNAWSDARLRSSNRSLQFGPGTSEIRQTITGLLPGRRYKVYGGVRRTNNTSTVKLGVRNYGYPALERTAGTVNRTTPLATGESVNNDASWWTMYNRSFITGPSSTTAEIYLSVVIPAGEAVVYVDDFCVELVEVPSADPVFAMPAFELPFNETSGTTAYDSTTNGKNGTVVGGATWSPGYIGNALNFDGINDYVTVPAPSVPSTPYGSFTVSTWVKFDGSVTNPNYPTLVRNSSSEWTANGWIFKVSRTGTATDFNLAFYAWDTNLLGAPGVGAGSVPPGQWAHVAFVVDRNPTTGAGTIKGYRDGALYNTGTIPAGFTGLNTALETRVGSPAFRGQLDNTRVDAYALSDAQIKALKNADSTKKLHLELDETASATKAWDASGNANHGTLTNMNTATAWGGGVLTFDGVNDYVATPTSIPTTPYGSFTVATWVKFDGSVTNPNYPTLVRNSSSEWTANGWIVKVSRTGTATNFNLALYMWDTNLLGAPGVGAGSVPPGQWAHVAFVVDRDPTTGAGTIKGYRDGVLYNTATIPAGFTGLNTTLGTRVGAPAFRGQLDDVRTYARALTWDEVLDLTYPQDGAPY